MKPGVILILTLLCFGKSDSLKLIKATSYKWSSGVQGMHGTKYSFVFVTGSSSSKMSVSQVWVGNNKLDFKTFKFGKTAQYKEFEKNDTIIISCEHIVNSRIKKDNYIIKPVPEYTGEAIILYKVGKKEKKIIIDKIESGKQQRYQ